VVSVQTCGGGGYGDPHDREPALLARDILERKISRARAQQVYGAAFDSQSDAALP
jgi:N-methylhydantoinase B